MRQNKSSDGNLLDALKAVPDEALEQKIEKSEGVAGATVEPVYSARRMRCYSVTESELLQIGLANIGITAFFSLGSALIAFWLDIFKDTVLASEVPKDAEVVISYVQPVLLFLGLLFWGFAGISVYWRHSMIKLIKQESTNS